MDLRQLRYFVSVVRERSFSKASEKLHVAQPALSRHIQTLEQELGFELLIRTPRGVETTEAGRLLKEKAEEVLRYVSEIKPSMSQLATEPTGDVILGLSPSLASLLALRIIDETKRRFPQLKVRIVEGLSIVLYEWLDQSRVDLALVTDFGHVPGIARRPIGEDEIVFVGTRAKLRAYAKSGKIPLRDIVKFPLVLTQGFHQLIAPRLTEEGVEPRFEMEISSTPIVTDIVLKGDHCTILASSFVKKNVDDGSLVALRFSGRPLRRRIVAAVKANRTVSAGIAAVETIIKEEIVKHGVVLAAANAETSDGG